MFCYPEWEQSVCFVRFLFILLGPKGKAKSYHEIGRAIATLMSDEVGVLTSPV